MPFLTTAKGIKLYYEHINADTDKPACLFISGLTRDHHIWREVIPLIAKDYQLITFDNRDVGQSSTVQATYTISDLADDAAYLLQHLKLGPVHLVGHSMGGFISIHLASKYPKLIKSLALCSTVEKQIDEAKRYLQLRIDAFATADMSINIASREMILLAMPYIYSDKHIKDPSFVEAIIAYETKNPYPQKLDSYLKQANACIDHDASHLLSKIHCPCMVITGAEDKLYTPAVAKALAEQIPGATCEVVPEAAHMLPLENVDYFCELLRQFWCRVDAVKTL